MIIQYVRKENREPYAVVVATDRNEIGVAQCNPKDKFVKSLGCRIAAERAKANLSWEDTVTRNNFDEVQRIVELVTQRSKRYYQ